MRREDFKAALALASSCARARPEDGLTLAYVRDQMNLVVPGAVTERDLQDFAAAHEHVYNRELLEGLLAGFFVGLLCRDATPNPVK